MAVGIRLVLSFGVAPLPHSPSARVRVSWTLASTGCCGRPTTQDGDSAPMKS